MPPLAKNPLPNEQTRAGVRNIFENRFLSCLPAGVQVFACSRQPAAAHLIPKSRRLRAPKLADYLGRMRAGLDAPSSMRFSHPQPSPSQLAARSLKTLRKFGL